MLDALTIPFFVHPPAITPAPTSSSSCRARAPTTREPSSCG